MQSTSCLANVEGLALALKLTKAALGKQKFKPILAMGRIDHDQNEGTRLTVTDLDVSVSVRILGFKSPEQPGAFMIPHAELSKVLKTAKDEEITLDARDGFLEVCGFRSRSNLRTEGALAYFPVCPAHSQGTASHWLFSAADLKTALTRCMAAVDADSTRFALGQVIVECQGERARFIATNGRVIVTHDAPCEHERGENDRSPYTAPARLNLSLSACKALLPLLGSDEPSVRIAQATHAEGDTTQSSILIHTERGTLWARCQAGAFPRYRDCIPTHWESHARIDLPELRAAVAEAIPAVKARETVGQALEFIPVHEGLRMEVTDGDTLSYERTIRGDWLNPLPDPFVLGLDYLSDFLKSLPKNAPKRDRWSPVQTLDFAMIDQANPVRFSLDSTHCVIMTMSAVAPRVTVAQPEPMPEVQAVDTPSPEVFGVETATRTPNAQDYMGRQTLDRSTMRDDADRYARAHQKLMDRYVFDGAYEDRPWRDEERSERARTLRALHARLANTTEGRRRIAEEAARSDVRHRLKLSLFNGETPDERPYSAPESAPAVKVKVAKPKRKPRVRKVVLDTPAEVFGVESPSPIAYVFSQPVMTLLGLVMGGAPATVGGDGAMEGLALALWELEHDEPSDSPPDGPAGTGRQPGPFPPASTETPSRGFLGDSKPAHVHRPAHEMTHLEYMGRPIVLPVPDYSIGKARYAKGKMAIQAPSTDGYKTRGECLAQALGGRWTSRESAWIVTPRQAERFETMIREGWDGNVYFDKPQLVPPGGEHRKLVERALAADLTVPDRVLADYPDLKTRPVKAKRARRKFHTV
jgi:DNA polymerase III sliding clamp (beta) subunit (PCNA family)